MASINSEPSKLERWALLSKGGKSHLVIWDVVSKEFSEGGLGTGNLVNRNLDLLAK